MGGEKEGTVDKIVAGAKKIYKGAKEIYYDLKGLPPEPETQKECEGWLKLPKQKNKGGFNEYQLSGNWYPEPLVKMWFYEEQVKVVSKKINASRVKIHPYELEIEKIEDYLKDKERESTADEIKEASLRARIEALVEQLRKGKEKGLQPSDPMYRDLSARIQALRKQLSTRTPSTENTDHIADWAVVPGGPKVPGQDLYVLISQHKAAIEKIEKRELKPLNVQLDRNEAYARFWKSAYIEFAETKKEKGFFD